MWLATTFHCTPKKHNVNPRNAKRTQAATLPPIRGLLAPCAMPQIDFSSRAKRNAAHPCIQPKPHPKSPESSSGGCSAPVEGAEGGSGISRAPDRLLLGPLGMLKRHTTDKLGLGTHGDSRVRRNSSKISSPRWQHIARRLPLLTLHLLLGQLLHQLHQLPAGVAINLEQNKG